MKRWILIHDHIIDPDYFNIFYIEHVQGDEWHIFGEDKNQICWRLAQFEIQEEAEIYLENFYHKIRN